MPKDLCGVHEAERTNKEEDRSKRPCASELLGQAMDGRQPGRPAPDTYQYAMPYCAHTDCQKAKEADQTKAL